MTTDSPQQRYPALADAFGRLDRLQEQHQPLFIRLYAPGVSLFLPDLVIQGFLKRSLDTLTGILTLVSQWNFTAAGALLRVQLDSLLRVAYLGTIPALDRDRVCREILGGESFNRIRGTDGRHLTDGRLRGVTEEQYPWLGSVYTETSKLIHFSDKHCFLTARNPNEESRTVEFVFGTRHPEWSESGLREFLAATVHATDSLLRVVEAWAEAKERATRRTSHPPDVSPDEEDH